MMSFKHVLTRNVKKIPFDNIHSGCMYIELFLNKEENYNFRFVD